MMRHVILGATVIGTLDACVIARAGEPKEVRPPVAAPAGGNDADALRGPAVVRHADRPERSIVQRDFQGRLKKLEESPVVAGLGKLGLSAEEKTRVEKALGDRAAALDSIVRDNLKLAVELEQAKQSKDVEGTARLQGEAMQKLRPFFDRGTLMSAVLPVLSDEHAAELERMVAEYRKVATAERMSDTMGGPKRENKVGAMLAQGFDGFAAELRASYERVVGAGGKEFEQLLKQLQLTPEQESKVRQKVGDLFQKTYGKPTKSQQIKVFLEVYAELTVEQRHTLAQYVGEENRVRRAGK